jgi:hypothetical protein
LGRSNRPQVVSCGAGGLTALGLVSSFLLFAAFSCCIGSGGVCFGSGELEYVQGELFVLLELWFGGLRSLFEHVFISDVWSRCPCLRGPRLVFFK